MATPEELRAAADAFAAVGKPKPDPFDLSSPFADAQALVDGALRGDEDDVERIKARMDAFAAAHPGGEDAEETG